MPENPVTEIKSLIKDIDPRLKKAIGVQLNLMVNPVGTAVKGAMKAGKAIGKKTGEAIGKKIVSKKPEVKKERKFTKPKSIGIRR